jgi:hypothetical protein
VLNSLSYTDKVYYWTTFTILSWQAQLCFIFPFTSSVHEYELGDKKVEVLKIGNADLTTAI